ncbi:Uma2 family endonuclease [Gemmatimonas sp.]|uniref:Uma2 family endonuclease n=1 Tax=Gemmatimonas sp. TaxID=1962908 RepID=UPI003562E63C
MRNRGLRDDPVARCDDAEELLANPVENARTELVRGRMIVREPAGWTHGDIAARVLVAISAHLTAERGTLGLSVPRGRVLAAETGFTLQRNPDTVRAPDVADVRWDRCPAVPPAGFAEFAPDLAVEVLSPADRAGEMLAKVGDWITAGTLLVWLVDPSRREARVYRADGSESTLVAPAVLSGENVLPGLLIELADVFD